MSITFAAITNTEKRCQAVIPVLRQTLGFKYRPHVLTPNLIAEFEASKDSGAQTAGFVDQFVRFISWWDIDDGDPPSNMPVNKDTVGNVSMFLLSAIMEAAVADVKPGEAKSSTS